MKKLILNNLKTLNSLPSDIKEILFKNDGIDWAQIPDNLRHLQGQSGGLVPVPQNFIPVPFFGNVETAEVAALSLNPSNVEFWDRDNPINKTNWRFIVKDINDLDQIYSACLDYFAVNPYETWFRNFNYISSKYSWPCGYQERKMGSFVNFDIIYWATFRKWDKLSASEQTKLKANTYNYDLIFNILENCSFTRIILSSINNDQIKPFVSKYFPDAYEFNERDDRVKIGRHKIKLGAREVDMISTNQATSYFNVL